MNLFQMFKRYSTDGAVYSRFLTGLKRKQEPLNGLILVIHYHR